MKRKATGIYAPYKKPRMDLGMYPRAHPRPTPIQKRRNYLFGIEKKYHDSSKSGTIIANTIAGSELDPTASALNVIAEGVTESTRDGRKIIMKSVRVQGAVYQATKNDQDDATSPTTVKVYLIRDSQTNGTQMNAEDALTGTIMPFVQPNLKFGNRFTILASKTFVLKRLMGVTDAENKSSQAGDTQTFDFYKKLNIPVNHTSTTASIANISDNSLHVIAIADTASDAYIKYDARVRFIG